MSDEGLLKAEESTPLEVEITQEQAASLGLAGRRLQESLDRYRVHVEGWPSRGERDRLLGEVASRAWALIVQREAIGFVNENLRWVCAHYDIPAAALARMGELR